MADQFFIDSSGEVVPVPADQAAGAAQLGWVPASPKQVSDYQLEQKYGTPGQGAIAFGEHAASAATMGLSDVAERALRVSTPEAMAGREKANPVASGAGTAVGVVAPLIATMGASAPEAAGPLARAAELSAPSLIAKVGGATTDAVRAALPVGETAIGRIAARAASSGAGSAIEGAAYGLGQVVHEEALGDPDLTAQRALATVGLSAALGGGMGFALGGAEGALPEVARKGKEIIGDAFRKGESAIGDLFKGSSSTTGTDGNVATLMLDHKQEIHLLEQQIPGIADEISNTTPEMAKFILDNQGQFAAMEKAFPGTTKQLARTSPETAQYLLDNWPKIITDPQERVKIASGLTDGMQKVVDTTNDILRRANTELRPAETESLLNGTHLSSDGSALEWVDKDQALNAAGRIGNAVSKAAEAMRAEPDLFAPSYARQLEVIFDGLKRDITSESTPAELFNRLRVLRQSIDEHIPFTKDMASVGLSERNAINQLKTLRSAVRSSLRDEGVWGAAGVRQAAFDDAQSEWLSLTKKGGDFNSKFMRKAQGTGGVSYEIKPTKLNTWLNQMADARGEDFAATWGRTMEAAKNVLDEVERSARAAGVQDFDRPAVESVINKSAELTADARQRAAVTQVKNQLDPRMSWGSMPVASSPVRDVAMKGLQFLAPGYVTSAVKATMNVAGQATSVPRAVATLAALERMGGAVSRKIDSGISMLLRGGSRAGQIGRGEVEAGIASAFGRSPEDARAAFQKRAAQVRQLNNDPTLMQGKLQAQTEDWHEHAPNTAQALQVTTARAVAFLASKLPVQGGAGPLAGKAAPSRSEISKFTRYYEAVQHPLSVLKQAAAGTLTPEAVEALQTVYPDIYEQVKATAIAKMAGRSNIPYRQKLMLSMLVGQDLDGSMASAARNFALYASQPTGPMKPPGRGAPKDSKITLATRMLTPSQASAQRKP